MDLQKSQTTSSKITNQKTIRTSPDGYLYVAFPIAYSLCSKGAKLAVIFTFIGASAICRVPMTVFEASFLGIRFTIVRLVVSLPLVVVTSVLLGRYLERHNYTMSKGK